MRTEEVIGLFRSEVDDPLHSGDDVDSLWKNNELEFYLKEARYEVARECYSFIKNTELTIEPGNPLVAQPEEFTELRWARLNGRMLDVVNLSEIANLVIDDYGFRSGFSADWEEHVGPIVALVKDFQTGFFRTYRILDEEEDPQTLQINHYAVPSVADCERWMSRPDEVRALLEYMKYLAYRKQDADVLDLDRSNQHFAAFNRMLGILAGRARRTHRRPGTTGYGGY